MYGSYLLNNVGYASEFFGILSLLYATEPRSFFLFGSLSALSQLLSVRNTDLVQNLFKKLMPLLIRVSGEWETS